MEGRCVDGLSQPLFPPEVTGLRTLILLPQQYLRACLNSQAKFRDSRVHAGKVLKGVRQTGKQF